MYNATTSRNPIRLSRESKLCELRIVEKTIDATGTLKGEESSTRFRLEALRSEGSSEFEVAIYRESTLPCRPISENPRRLRPQARVWTRYDLIRSILTTPEAALAQVLRMLELRCE
jgi:hypothetical protein